MAIAIPIFTSQLEKSREATDLANIRSAYAEVMAASLTDPDNDHSATVTKKQTESGWQGAGDVAGITIAGSGSEEINSTEDTVVAYVGETGKITIDDVEPTTSFVD